MMRFLYIVFTLILSVGETVFAVEVYFSPSPDCENRIVKAIESSQKEIYVAVYSINNRKIVNALMAAKLRGVQVRVLTDRVQASQRSSKVFEMLENGLDVRVHSKHKIEHNKFGVYDGKLVSTGSFNWTGPASRSNSENCVFLEDPSVITKFSERFHFLWKVNTSEGSRTYIARLQTKNRQINNLK